MEQRRAEKNREKQEEVSRRMRGGECDKAGSGREWARVGAKALNNRKFWSK